jgi:hypothetical protein
MEKAGLVLLLLPWVISLPRTPTFGSFRITGSLPRLYKKAGLNSAFTNFINLYLNISFMKTFQILVLGLLVSPACGQKKKNDAAASQSLHGRLLSIADSLHKPNYQAQVNKQYDKNGRLTRYDSTYTYSWHGRGAQLPPGSDSLLLSIFRDHAFSGDADPFRSFLSDSLFIHNDAFNAGFFRRQMEANRRMMEQFFRSDSLLAPHIYPSQ